MNIYFDILKYIKKKFIVTITMYFENTISMTTLKIQYKIYTVFMIILKESV